MRDEPEPSPLSSRSEHRDQRFMLAALDAAGATLRTYDLKAQIGMVAFAVVTNTIGHLIDLGMLWQRHPATAKGLVILFVLTLLAYLAILFPRVLEDGATEDAGGRKLNVFFLRSADYPTAADYLAALRGADHDKELAQQLLNLSRIRDTKHRRTVLAIGMSASFYAIVAVLALTR